MGIQIDKDGGGALRSLGHRLLGSRGFSGSGDGDGKGND